MASRKSRPLVMIVWLDAAHDTFGWGKGLEAEQVFEVPLVQSVGWLIARTKQGIKIAQSLTSDNIAQTLVVPARMIQKIINLPNPLGQAHVKKNLQ